MTTRQHSLGAHMSIAGGYYKAVEAAAALEMDCVQLFPNGTLQSKSFVPKMVEEPRNIKRAD